MKLNFEFANIKQYEEIISHSQWWIDSPPTKESYELLLKSDLYYIVYINWKIVWSFSILPMWNDTLMIQFLRVKKQFRRKWIWKQIIKYILLIAYEKKRVTIISTVLKNNQISINFHKNAWFDEWWIIKFNPDELVFLKYI